MKTIITIGRQNGSGGRMIGKRVAEIFNIPYYDKEILSRAAKESGMCEEIFEKHDQKPTNSFLYNLVMDTYNFGYSSVAFSELPMNHKIFLAQFDAIKKIAKEGPCVLVGRCADYALEDNEDAFSIFITADPEKRIERIMETYQLDRAKAKEKINKADKGRSSYYNYYSSKKWGEASGYDLCINSSVFGIEGTAQMIAGIIRNVEKNRK